MATDAISLQETIDHQLPASAQVDLLRRWIEGTMLRLEAENMPPAHWEAVTREAELLLGALDRVDDACRAEWRASLRREGAVPWLICAREDRRLAEQQADMVNDFVREGNWDSARAATGIVIWLVLEAASNLQQAMAMAAGVQSHERDREPRP